MSYKDYYRILGVKPTATPEEIKQAFKKLAVKFHPDKNPNDPTAEEKFKEINEAREVLLNPDNRKKYNDLANAWRQAYQGTARPSGVNPEDVGQDSSSFDRVFQRFMDEVFGAATGARKGRDLDANIRISLEEAYSGMEEVFTYEGRRMRVKIRKGIADGQVLRFKGQGEPGKNGGEPGDFLLTVKIKASARFQREADDLLSSITIDVLTAILGGKKVVTTLKGEMQITIPVGVQPGQRLRLSGLGMPDYDGSGKFGDLLLEVKVKIPTRLSAAERTLYQQLANLKKS